MGNCSRARSQRHATFSAAARACLAQPAMWYMYVVPTGMCHVGIDHDTMYIVIQSGPDAKDALQYIACLTSLLSPFTIENPRNSHHSHSEAPREQGKRSAIAAERVEHERGSPKDEMRS